jgi:Lrp/AsnC family transcriptional regulator for asnA, asnC and gidA
MSRGHPGTIGGIHALTKAVTCVRTDARVTPRSGLLDDVNKAIVEQLQADGRRSYAAIAQAVGLSEAAVRQRIQRLLDAGVMQIVAVTDPMQMGFARQAMIGVNAEGDLREVAHKLSALPEVDYVVITAGSFDILLEVVCENDEHLLSLLSDSIRAVPGIRDTETFVYLRLAKQTYTWGTR